MMVDEHVVQFQSQMAKQSDCTCEGKEEPSVVGLCAVGQKFFAWFKASVCQI